MRYNSTILIINAEERILRNLEYCSLPIDASGISYSHFRMSTEHIMHTAYISAVSWFCAAPEQIIHIYL